MSCESEIFPAIVESFAVSMVNEHAGRGVHNLPVHRKDFCSVIGVGNEANSIGSRTIFLGTPIEGVERVEIPRVNDGEFAFA